MCIIHILVKQRILNISERKNIAYTTVEFKFAKTQRINFTDEFTIF